jgi:hypothetical protein
MRTGIYVQKPTTVSIRASAPADARVQLRRFPGPGCEADARAHLREPMAVGTHQLDVGIYLIVSSSPMQIAGAGVTTQIVANDKDPWPEIGATVVGLVSDATSQAVEAIRNFFAVTKGIEVGDPPPESTAPGTTKITDDPDGL